jgi:mannose-6-phosphate isomerase-like protein (cupin superfamily)
MTAIVELAPRITENVGDFLGQMHHFSDGLYAKQMLIPAGYVVFNHTHEYSHLSMLASGDVVVEVEGVANEFSGPACIEIKAGLEHKIFARTDAVWFCIHATSETDVDKIDEVFIGKEV